MWLIGCCLSNTPNLRPSASDLVERMREATAQHPLTFSNRVEMMQRMMSKEREKEELQTSEVIWHWATEWEACVGGR